MVDDNVFAGRDIARSTALAALKDIVLIDHLNLIPTVIRLTDRVAIDTGSCMNSHASQAGYSYTQKSLFDDFLDDCSG